MNPGPHLISLINFLFGTPKKINSTFSTKFSSEVEDTADLKLHFNKYIGTVSLNWSLPNRRHPLYKIEIEFAKIKLIVDSDKIIIINNYRQKIIRSREITPIYTPIFNINPTSYGESYYLEDKLFIEAVKNNDLSQKKNSLKNSLISESIIFRSYKDL